MNLSIKSVLLLLIPLSLTFSCVQTFNAIKGSGVIVYKTFKTKSYDSIEVIGNMDVILFKGVEGEIGISTDDNLYQYLVVEEKNNVLVIKIKDYVNIQPKKGIEILVPFEEVSSVKLTGSGRVKMKKSIIKSDNFIATLTGSGSLDLVVEANQVTAEVTGSGLIIMSGSTTNLEVEITGSGEFKGSGVFYGEELNGEELKTENATVKLVGSGWADVCSEFQLDAEVNGSGIIMYKGDPTEKIIEKVGSGFVYQFEELNEFEELN